MVDRDGPELDPDTPRPLDERMATSLAFRGPLSDTDIRDAERHLEFQLEEIREKRDKKEWGVCLAWWVDAPYEDRQRLAKHLVEAMGARGKAREVPPIKGIDILWSGTMYGGQVDLLANQSDIGLNNDTTVNATMLLLSARFKNSST